MRSTPEVLSCMFSIFVDRNRNLGGKIDDTIGYTDGSLFKVKKPSVENNRQAFMGRKNYPCINAQIVRITPVSV